MTKNMEIMFNQIRQIIETKFTNKLPTVDQIYSEANALREVFKTLCPVTDEEFESIKKRLPENILHSIGYADTLRKRDSAHQYGWYKASVNDGFFWNRYKDYLSNIKKWSKPVVERLHNTTEDVMDDLGNPKSENPFQRRGLLLGDVQSGKTATYTAICNKATDAGYKVIIVLAGMMENLRIQTQERLDAEFVGLDSKYSLDKKADSSMRNIPVGVGKIPPFAQDKRITRFTSVQTDFNASVIKSNGLNLNDLKGTALFVVKKNKSVLNNLFKWLTKDEDVLNLPMLLIDDEADNASVNTNSDEMDPTAINAAINKILRAFKQATYLGITATPFANIFIDPQIADDGAAKDLFPRHFLTLLPTPDSYIGADKIFGNGNEDDWNERQGGEYGNSIIEIKNDEQEDFFVFKHKKELADELYDLPPSLYEAIGYFCLVNAISDFRYDANQHRSMMVNVSRFTNVQNVTAELIEEYMGQIKSDLENYSQLPVQQAMKINNIRKLNYIWDKYKLETVAGLTWECLLKEYLFKAVRRIEVRPVNKKTGAKSLDYYNYKEIGMRVIAVGGNSLSRGLTLEGLCVSYFYRNTMMYDTLLQMGRWFGYRNNYDDLFKIFENNPNMQETYRLNHSKVDVRGDVCGADYKELEKQYGKIDVVIGGPPCQGFSNANRQRNHAISQNNMLVKQYIRAIVELQPKAFVMENVSMLKSDVHRFYLDKKDKNIVAKYNIPTKETEILLIDEEYMFEGALEIVSDKAKINQYLWPEEHYFEMNIIFKACKNSEKLVKALEKHKKNLLKFSEEIIIEGKTYHWYSTKRKEDSNTVLSIHKSQGFDLNYAGVIFGKEIYYDLEKKRVEVNRKELRDSFTKSEGEASMRQYLLNIYLTLMTRGINGTYVYAVDDNLREYLKNFLN